jgi:hypothetical protein
MLFSEHCISSQGRANRKRAAREELNLIFLNIRGGVGIEIFSGRRLGDLWRGWKPEIKERRYPPLDEPPSMRRQSNAN